LQANFLFQIIGFVFVFLMCFSSGLTGDEPKIFASTLAIRFIPLDHNLEPQSYHSKAPGIAKSKHAKLRDLRPRTRRRFTLWHIG